MKVSIIVPCYKVEKYLPTCIESVQYQSYPNWELILVDDGSPDRCGEICDEYAKKDKRIRVIHKQNGGLSDARNAGLDIMKGGYVTFLDGDDFWHTDYLKVLMGFLYDNSVDISQCEFVKGTETVFPEIHSPYSVSYFDNHSIFTKQAAKIIMCGKIYRASFFNEIRMPVGKIHEDDWTTWKLYYQAKKIALTTQPLYYYTENPNSIMCMNKKKPDFSYFDAYEERIEFFGRKNEKDLVDVSRMQFCKSLLLLFGNETLSNFEKNRIKTLFDGNWSLIKTSSEVPTVLKILFGSFKTQPELVSKLIRVISLGFNR